MSDPFDAILAVLEAKDADLLQLIDIAGLDPATDFINGDLTGIDLRFTDLDGFNLKGCRVSQGALPYGFGQSGAVMVNAPYVPRTPIVDRKLAIEALELAYEAQGRRDFDVAQELYQKSLRHDPDFPDALILFAHFIEIIRKNIAESEPLYYRAVSIAPNNSTVIGRYARFLHMHDGHGDAENYYRRSLEIDPNDGWNLSWFADYMHNVRGDMDEAERLYRRAESADPENNWNLTCFGEFMQKVRGDMREAERLYKASYDLASDDIWNLLCYAEFMFEQKRDVVEATRLYGLIADSDDQDGYALAQCAVFTHAVLGNLDEAERLWRLSVAVDTHNVWNLFRFGYFMEVVRQDAIEAEHLYRRVLEIDLCHVMAMERLALVLLYFGGRQVEVINLYRRILACDQKRENSKANLACLLIGQGGEDEAHDVIERVFAEASAQTAQSVILECWFYRYAVFPDWRDQAEGEILYLLADGIRSPGWDLSAVVARALELGHPDPDRLRDFADRISQPEPT